MYQNSVYKKSVYQKSVYSNINNHLCNFPIPRTPEIKTWKKNVTGTKQGETDSGEFVKQGTEQPGKG